MKTIEKKNDWYLQSFDILEKSLNGESKTPIHSIRRNAFARFLELGFPTVRDEEWRFTNIAQIRNSSFEPAFRSPEEGITKTDLEKLFLTESSSARLVFINGHYSHKFSQLTEGIAKLEAGSLAGAIKRSDPTLPLSLAKYASYDQNAFVALSTAFMQDGAFIRVGDDASIEHPIECLFLTTSPVESLMASPRNLFMIGNNSKVTILESYVGLQDQPYLDNVVTEIVVGRNSTVEHDKLGLEGRKAYHVCTTHVHQLSGSNYTNNSISLGGIIIRNNITVVLAEAEAVSTLNGLSLGTGDQLIDNHTTIDHTKPNCTSHELYKSILAGRAKGVFNGKIFVRQDAQKTDAKQTNKTLLLSDDATIDTKPQLEIFADDVRCTHGATVGQLDEEQIFYLRSRGIGERFARDILTTAFAGDVIEKIRLATSREHLRRLIRERLEETRPTRN